jgi:hypothetical protein
VGLAEDFSLQIVVELPEDEDAVTRPFRKPVIAPVRDRVAERRQRSVRRREWARRMLVKFGFVPTPAG